jgi:hypothetical protein
MKNNVGTMVYSALVLFSGALIADAGSSAKSVSFEQGSEIKGIQMTAGYNHAARVSTTSDWDMFLTARFLYWDVQQEGMEIGPLFLTNPTMTNIQPSGSSEFKDEYRAGFKVGLGWNTPFDDWVVSAEYTWFHHDIHKSQSGPFLTSNFLQAKATPFDYATEDLLTSSSHKWNIDLDVIDVMVSRPFYQGTRLTLNPSFGLKGLLLNQKYTITGNISGGILNPTKAYGKTDSWAVGPSLGIQGNFLLGAGFRLEGSMSGALVFTRYNSIKYFAKTQAAGKPDLNLTSEDQNRVRSIADAQAGFGWGTYLCNQKYHLDLSATYEFQVFWNQNMINWYSASLIGLNGSSPGNLYFHGLTASATFDF